MQAATLALRFVLQDVLGDVLRFPVWWYSVGLLGFVGWAGGRVNQAWHNLGIGAWISHIFSPMYGQRDWQGRIISFFARLLIIFARLVGFVLYSAVFLVLCAVWVCLPPAVAILLLLQVSNLGF